MTITAAHVRVGCTPRRKKIRRQGSLPAAHLDVAHVTGFGGHHKHESEIVMSAKPSTEAF